MKIKIFNKDIIDFLHNLRKRINYAKIIYFLKKQNENILKKFIIALFLLNKVKNKLELQQKKKSF